MKSICFIVQNYYDMDPRVRRKAECLAAIGYNVDVIALHSPERNSNPYYLNDVRVFGIPIVKRRASIVRYLYEYCLFFVKAMNLLNKLIRDVHYEMN